MVEKPALVIAGHGTRKEEGMAAAAEFVTKVQALLPDVSVSAGYVELTPPTIDEALSAALAKMKNPRAVVVPLMVGTGGHVRMDIPEAIAEGRADSPIAQVAYTAHLGPDPRLIDRVIFRIDEARNEWAASDTTVVFVGRGALVPEANADHCRLARLIQEKAHYASIDTCYIQVVEPNLRTGLDNAKRSGARKIVVMPNFLFPGRLRDWTREISAEWQAKNPDVEVRVGEVLGPCDELAAVVVDRYLATVPDAAPVYLSGLMLNGREVLVVGAGNVAARRVRALLDVGAKVTVVSPEADPVIVAYADAGLLTWHQRRYRAGDGAGAWYILALTNDPQVNAEVVRAAEAQHTFVVRGDKAAEGSAYTPAMAHTAGLSVGVVGDRNPRRSLQVRDELFKVLSAM
ncbi:MAG: cobalamin biosynthesis protein [Actinomycetales bacterium]|nr:MAG: cobalamin biosynthesis protein [Actinomycetales bacterium]